MVEKRLTKVARKLRAEMTDAERLLWSRLRGKQLHGFQFTRQFPIGPYVVDFACRRAKLAIELDGGQHADSAGDVDRTQLIEAHGYTVIRFWNHEVLREISSVLEAIRHQLVLMR